MLHTRNVQNKALLREGILFLGQWGVLAGILFLVLQGIGAEHALQQMETVDVQNVLNMLGTFTTSENSTQFWAQGKLIEISALCSGLLEMVLLASVILITPNEGWKKKIIGAAVGVGLLYAFNILRMIISIQQLVHTPYSFAEFTHDILFRIILIAGFAFLYWAWVNWTYVHQKLIREGLI